MPLQEQAEIQRLTCPGQAAAGLCLLKQLGSGMTFPAATIRCTHCEASIEQLESEIEAVGRHLSADESGSELSSECQRAMAAVEALEQSPFDLSTIDSAEDSSANGTVRGPSVEELTAALPGYLVTEQIGQGGMGAVYLATQLDLNRAVALKVLQTSSRRKREELAARFQREAQITARLDHPSIVPAYNTGFDDTGLCWYTMRLVRGSELKDVIRLAIDRRDGWNVDRALAVLVKICQAMAFAHSRGAVHRDLKPGNVMVGEHGEVYVMDWGLARMTNDETDLDTMSGGHAAEGDSTDDPWLTADGAIIGTPAYMPPEQARGAIEQVDHLSDIYALGAILYQLLTGRAPYTSPDRELSAQEFLQAVIESPPERVAALNPRALPELVAICERAMHRDRDQRYCSAADMADELQAYLRLREDSHDVVTLNRHLQKRSSQSDPEFEAMDSDALRQSADQQQQRRRRVIIWLTTAVVLLAGIIIVIKTQDGKEFRVEADRIPADWLEVPAQTGDSAGTELRTAGRCHVGFPQTAPRTQEWLNESARQTGIGCRTVARRRPRA